MNAELFYPSSPPLLLCLTLFAFSYPSPHRVHSCALPSPTHPLLPSCRYYCFVPVNIAASQLTPARIPVGTADLGSTLAAGLAAGSSAAHATSWAFLPSGVHPHWWHLIGGLLFVYASWHQHRCHVILVSVARWSALSGKHCMPRYGSLTILLSICLLLLAQQHSANMARYL